MLTIYLQNNTLSSQIVVDILYTSRVIYSAGRKHLAEVTTVSIREQKGQQIADRMNIQRQGNLYVVPSQSGRGKYTVNPEPKRCTCPDYDFRRQPCKHIFAVECVIERQKVTTTDAQGN